MAEFELNGHLYRTTKLDARTQFHVVRRLAPVLGSFKDLLPLYFSGQLEGADVPALIAAAEPLTKVISQMEDEAVNYVLDACLKVTSRKQGESWVKVWNQSAGRLQYEDIEMVTMLQIASQVLSESLSGFFDALQSA